jgi:hypothetical protein
LNLKIYSEGEVLEEKFGTVSGGDGGIRHRRRSPQKSKKAKQQFTVTRELLLCLTG